MTNLPILMLSVLLASNAHGAEPVISMVDALTVRQGSVRRVERTGASIGAAIRLCEQVSGRSAPCPAGVAGTECWLVFRDELPARFFAQLWLSDASEGDSVSGRPPGGREPLRLGLPPDGWWRRASLHIEAPGDQAAAVPTLRCLAPAVAPSVIVQHEPVEAECVIDGLTPGDWIVSVVVDLGAAFEGPRLMESMPRLLLVRDGTEDEQSANAMDLRDARRSRAVGDHVGYEKHMMRWLARHPTWQGWQALAEGSLGQGPLETTATYYSKAREMARSELAAIRQDSRGANPAEVDYLTKSIARLGTFEAVLPYLKANPRWKFHAPEKMGPAPDDEFYAISGPGVWVPFRALDESVLAKLKSATRR